MPKRSPLLFFFSTVVVIALVALFGPQEKSLGSNVRIVYLHGVWVLTAEVAFLLAGICGALALLSSWAPLSGLLRTRQAGLHAWSQALGRTGITFWVTYLPLSLWAMQANWNGLFLAEPRFRLALTFAVVGLLLQGGLTLLNMPWLTSLGNVAFIVVLRIVFSRAQNIMHPPPSPIFKSGLWDVIVFFILLNFLTWLAAWFLTRWWYEKSSHATR